MTNRKITKPFSFSYVVVERMYPKCAALGVLEDQG